ncbi:ABC transporter permease [Brevibacillus ginsengisoli]|uniref:ABC transporter permease n=1 Tax=Brevibacillus ginsengisoli TaxID=363854 RepID=UPI003CF4FFD3
MIYIWKEWKEQSRGKGLWLAMCMVILISFFILQQSRSFPSDEGFEIFLLSLYEMNVFLIPLLSLFIASFAIMQEKEQKTLTILLTKKESYRTFLLKKSMAIQLVTILVFVGWYCIFSLPMKAFLPYSPGSFLPFILSITIVLFIFNQLGIFLGSICSTRMQLVGANIFTWFLFVFLIDLAFLYYIPVVTDQNIKTFSILFFLDPLHTVHFYLESALGLFPIDHMSRLMQKMVFLSPVKFLLIDIVIWFGIIFEFSVWFRVKGEKV